MSYISKKFMLLVSASILFVGCASQSHTDSLTSSRLSEESTHAKYAVGIRWQSFSSAYRRNWDNTAPRPMNSVAFYPAVPDTYMYDINIPEIDPIFLGGVAAPNAPVADHTTKYPLVLLSHGTGGSALQMMWLGRRLAEHGYVAVAIDHHGNTGAETKFDPRGFLMPWERATDISEVIDALFAASPMQDQIDPDDISAIGFSLGGYTVTSVAGGIYNRDRFEAFCQSSQRDAVCDPQIEYPKAIERFNALLETDKRTQEIFSQSSKSVKNKRVRRTIAIAPALAQALSDESLERIDSPFLIIAGNSDKTVPISTNAERLVKKIPNAKLKTLDGVGHYAFLNECSEEGKKLVPVCAEDASMPRKRVHDKTAELILSFLAEHRTPK